MMRPDIPIADIFYDLQLLQESERYSQLLDGVAQAGRALATMKPCMLVVVDDTNAGGKHVVHVLVNPTQNEAYIFIPPEPNVAGGEPGVKGGRFPTVCHAVELLVASSSVASIEFPTLRFSTESGFLDVPDLYEAAKESTFLMPLTIDPPNTNVLICHTQVPHIDPQQLLLGWYEVVKQDDNLVNDPIRHTILVMPKSQSDEHTNDHFVHDQPPVKTVILAETLPKEVVNDRARFRPLHLNRVSRWGKLSDLNNCSTPTVEPTGRRYSIDLR